MLDASGDPALPGSRNEGWSATGIPLALRDRHASCHPRHRHHGQQGPRARVPGAHRPRRRGQRGDHRCRHQGRPPGRPRHHARDGGRLPSRRALRGARGHRPRRRDRRHGRGADRLPAPPPPGRAGQRRRRPGRHRRHRPDRAGAARPAHRRAQAAGHDGGERQHRPLCRQQRSRPDAGGGRRRRAQPRLEARAGQCRPCHRRHGGAGDPGRVRQADRGADHVRRHNPVREPGARAARGGGLRMPGVPRHRHRRAVHGASWWRMG